MRILDEILMCTGSLCVGFSLGGHWILRKNLPVYLYVGTDVLGWAVSGGLVLFIAGLILSVQGDQAWR